MKCTLFNTLFVTVLTASFGVVSAQVQTSALNSNAIHEFGTTFSPFAKFAAFGESGSVVGPTITGCDLYGFRAQFALNQSVNIGMQRTGFAKLPILPTISTSTDLGLGIVEESTSSISTGVDVGCGSLLAYFKKSNSSFSNNVLTIFGSATASGGSWTTSDRTLKRDIQPIENALDIVSRLNGYTYEYRRDERPDLNLPQGTRYGFITQEVQEVMPTVVRQSTDFDGSPANYQVMEYDAIIPVLTEAIKLQQGVITDMEEEVADLRKENSALEARLARLEALMLGDRAGATNQKLDAINNASGIKLEQNRPNPSDGTTAIEYTLPTDMTNANLVVVDLNGRTISTQAINDVNGVVELNTASWAAGTYIYSIVVEGRALARQKMIVQ